MAMQLTENALTVLQARYLLRDRGGQVVETPEEPFGRVARSVAQAEAHFGDASTAAISGDLLSAVISTRYSFGFRKHNSNVFNMLVKNLPVTSDIKYVCY